MRLIKASEGHIVEHNRNPNDSYGPRRRNTTAELDTTR